MAGPSSRTGSHRRLGTSKAQSTLHHPTLKHDYRATEGNASRQPRSPCVLSGDAWDKSWDGFLSPAFRTKWGRICLRWKVTVSERCPKTMFEWLSAENWETLAVLSIAICELLWFPCPELDKCLGQEISFLDRVSPTQTAWGTSGRSLHKVSLATWNLQKPGLSSSCKPTQDSNPPKFKNHGHLPLCILAALTDICRLSLAVDERILKIIRVCNSNYIHDSEKSMSVCSGLATHGILL